MITGGNILRHDVIHHYDHEVVGRTVNADIVHEHGFFVGNHPKDVRPQIDRLRAVLDAACA
jgi:CDP-4-dehydro-6-deoxyglucose reductase, E1